jgi:uncharacterized protein YhbP (UPF0306 family)
MSISTLHNGQAHAASVFYVNVGFDLYFISSPSSRHGEDLAINPRAAVTINEDYNNWLDIKGLQLSGKVRQVGRIADHAEIADAFTHKFPDVGGFFGKPDDMPESIADKVAKVLFYRFRPSSIFYIDNSQGFGHKEELVLEDRGSFKDPT